MTTTYHRLDTGAFTQDWSNTALIASSDAAGWAGVPSIMGYRGDGMTASTSTNPQTTTADGSATPVNVIANQTNPNTLTTGGVAEFHLTNPTVAFQGSGTADAPHLVIHLDTTNRQGVTVSYNLRDIDGSADNAIQRVALQYRIGETGAFIDVPAGYVADASAGPSLATLSTAVSVTLPSAVNNQAKVQVRIITNDAAGSDEWVGVDDIVVSGSPISATPTVNLQATSIAREAGQSQIVLTAEASADVSGDRVLTLALAGTGVAASDFSGPLQITIPAGQRTGSVTLTLLDDQLAEGDETATFSISQFAGLTPGGTTSASVRLVDSSGVSTAPGYNETFNSDLGLMQAFSADADTGRSWRVDGGRADANAFGGSSPADDWLISRAFDLNATDVEFLRFSSWKRFEDAGIAEPELQLLYSMDYAGTGAPGMASWTALPFAAAPLTASNSAPTTPSGLVDLSAISGSDVHFAFRYISSGNTGDSASRWAVDDLQLQGYTGSVLLVRASDAFKDEGAAGTQTSFDFSVTRMGDLSGIASANWTLSGTGIDAADFGGVLPSGTVSFADGQAERTITVQVAGDAVLENDETLTLTLSGPVNTSIVQATAAGAILDDDLPVSLISQVQGSGNASAFEGDRVTVQGMVTAWLPERQGFFLQEEAGDDDGNAATSEGIFVYYGGRLPAGLGEGSVGDTVQVTGQVDEFNGLTEITNLSRYRTIVDTASAVLPEPVIVSLPVSSLVDWESVEGMRVTVRSATGGGALVVTDTFDLGRYGQVTLTSDELLEQYTEGNLPSEAGYAPWQQMVQRDQIVIDDSRTVQNPDPNLFGRGGQELTADNTLRAGDGVVSVTGIVDQDGAPSGALQPYRIQLTAGVDFSGPARPTANELPAAVRDAQIKVASANVLNYFTDVGPDGTTFTNPSGTVHEVRGANDAQEFARQQVKIVANLLALDADVIGLMEMQNNGFGDGTSAIDSLVDAMNAAAGGQVYAYVGPYDNGSTTAAANTGGDAIMVAIVYKLAAVMPVGVAAAADPALYDAFSATYGNRVPVAQSFQAVEGGDVFTVVVNHFKSKGSATSAQGLDQDDGQGNANLARLEAVQDLAAWLATDPTGITDPDVLLIGDFNAYAQEDPVEALEDAGYDRVSSGYSYSFDGFWGSLDHAFASDTLTAQVAGTAKWAINAEEPTALDYDTAFKTDRHDALLFAPDAYRSSDHNPLLIGLNLFTGRSYTGTSSRDTLTGGDGPDTLNGGGGNDLLVGLERDDWLDGGSGTDTLDGGTGNDTYVVNIARDVLVDAGGFDTVLASLDWELAQGFEHLVLTGNGRRGTGNFGDNTLTGNALGNGLDGGFGDDLLQGLAGGDTLTGGFGDDTLAGGAGTDQLSGGWGDDRFLFATDGGDDRILDFLAGDRLVLDADLNGSGIVDAASAFARARQVNKDVKIDLGDGDSVTLVGVKLSLLTLDHFEVVGA
jgi:predicted extracellular nuclease